MKQRKKCGKVCTVNVGTMVGESREVVEMLARRNMDICCVQETRYRGAGSKTIGCGKETISSGESETRWTKWSKHFSLRREGK